MVFRCVDKLTTLGLLAVFGTLRAPSGIANMLATRASAAVVVFMSCEVK